MSYSKTWPSVFNVSAGISALIAVGGCLTVDPDRPSEEKDKRVDWIGSLLITSGLVLIIFVLSDGAIAPQGWRTPCEYRCCFASPADPHNLGVFGLTLTSADRYNWLPRGRCHLDSVVLLLECFSLQGSCPPRTRIVDRLVATSTIDSWRLVAPRKWAVLGDSHDCILDVVFIPV
jgi:hypothetical protein